MLESIAIHISIWNEWRKHNTNSKFHKLLVLLGLRHSPTLTYFGCIQDGAEKLNAIKYTFKDVYGVETEEIKVDIKEVQKDG